MKTLRSLLILTAIFLAISTLSAVSASAQVIKENDRIIVKNVVRVFLHDPGTTYDGPADYSIMYQVGNDFVIKRLFYMTDGEHINMEKVLLRKIEPQEPMRVEIVCTSSFILLPDKWTATIYIHNPDDIGGGGWERREGKTTVNGQTEVVR